VPVPKNSLIDAASARQFLRCRSEALTKAFLLTPRDTDVSWSLRNPEAGSLGDDQSKRREEAMKARSLPAVAGLTVTCFASPPACETKGGTICVNS
jgi:hypothetical protein